MDNTAGDACPTCGAPLQWSGPISMPEEDERAGEGALFFAWTCGHDALLPLPFDEAEIGRLLALRERIRSGTLAGD